jgi:N-acetylglutamate synthase-like GNAT family acetyltransferase
MVSVEFLPASVDDADALASLRVAAMQPSLEAADRFDLVHARQQFLADYSPEHTCHVMAQGERVGCVVVKPDLLGFLLQHLYIHPQHQSRGAGGAVLAKMFALADAAQQDMRVVALRGSDANRFFSRHGFIPMQEVDWEVYYTRPHTSSSI